MPEGPSIVILKEAAEQFTGQQIISVSGNTKIDVSRFKNERVKAFKTWGKHFLICFDNITIRIHLLLFGSYLINEIKTTPVRLGLKFKTGAINFYNCSVKVLEGDINTHYDWSVDVMNDEWNAEQAELKLRQTSARLICDALLNQDIFAGIGNIIKNEVLYRVQVHPESLTGKIPANKIKSLIKEARIYSFQFLEWKKNYVLKQHWLAHTKQVCLRCNLPIIRKQTGTYKRRSFFCINCQPLYK